MRITSATVAQPVGGVAGHQDAGAEISVSERDAESLVEAGKAVRLDAGLRDGMPASKSQPTAKPAVFVPAEVPASFRDLPASFTRAWRNAEALRGLEWGAARAEAEARAAVVVDAEGKTRGSRALLEKLDRAKDALEKFSREGVARDLFECGASMLSEVRAANAAREELLELAFEIFAQRLAALELQDEHARRLFARSALRVRYELAPIAEHDLRLAHGVEFVDAPLVTIGTTLANARALRKACAEKKKAALAEREVTARMLGAGRKSKQSEAAAA